VLIVTLGAISIKRGWIGYMPPLEELQNPINKYASQVLSCDGKLLGTWSRSENRVFVDYDSISSHMINALIATEDVRFYDHSGIDIKALFRAIIKRGIFQQKEAGGGSTITQQLAKNMYFGFEPSLIRKIAELFMTNDIENNYSKDEILELYINIINYGDNHMGIYEASIGYFNKHPKNLSFNDSFKTLLQRFEEEYLLPFSGCSPDCSCAYPR
jgi:penicillin-binding protein 1A